MYLFSGTLSKFCYYPRVFNTLYPTLVSPCKSLDMHPGPLFRICLIIINEMIFNIFHNHNVQ